MMSNVAANLAKVQGTVSRWSRPSLGVVWGRRQEGGNGNKAFLCMSPCSLYPHNFAENEGFLSLLCKGIPKG